MTPTMKFATRNFLGKPRAFYLVEECGINTAPAEVPAVSDLILVVDASGSMYGDMASMRETVLKVFTLDEYRESKVRVTVISYSSKGDVVTHFERASIADIAKTESQHQRQIRALTVRGLTCISQGLLAARDVAKKAAADGGTIAVQLLSDGYANDSSPTAEKREIEAIVESFKGIANLFCNTIAFRSSSDFQLLASVSNALSGSCIQATSIKQVYDAIYDTEKLVAGKTFPTLQLPLGDWTQQVFVSRSAKKILGASADLTVCGLAADDDRTVYRYKRVTESAYKKAKLSEASSTAMYAFARAAISEGALNTAKYAMVSTRNWTFLQEHGKALTGEQIAAFADALDQAVFLRLSGTPEPKTYGFAKPATSVLDVCRILDAHKGGFSVDVVKLVQGYRRRGVKRLLGTRGPDGKVVPPTLRTVYRDEDNYVSVGGFDTNRNTATINMMIVQPVDLVRADGSVVKDVAGIKLTDRLTDYKQYTIVGDGVVNIPSLSVRISDKKLWKTLLDAEVVSGDFVPGESCVLDFASRPLVSYDAAFDPAALSGLPERIFRLRVLSSLLGALLREASTSYTPDQVKALREHYLSEKLYVNFPTCNPYIKEQDAASRGEIDYKVSYKVNFGVPEALSPSTFYSANEFLARWYTCEGVADSKKPKLIEWWQSKFKATRKDHSKLKSITLVDTLMAGVFDDFLGLDPFTPDAMVIENIANLMDLPPDEYSAVREVFDRKLTEDKAVEVLTSFRKRVDAAIDDIFSKEISPLVFFVGATGLIPDEWGELKALTAEQLVVQFPIAQLSKDEREATFYVVPTGKTSPPVILSIFAKSEPYSTERGVQAVKAQQAVA